MVTLTTEVLVIGGGATGTGVAWDASLRGLDVVLVDRGDLAEGTSGRFHGMLHSGGRYAVKDPAAATECIAENRILRRVAADCVEDTGGLIVTTPWDDPDYADRFAQGCRETGVDCEEIAVAEALRQEPRLNPEISRAFRVPDASIDAFKTVGALSRGAQQLGARILPYRVVTEIHRRGDVVTGARVLDARSGEELEIEARVTVNATGAWAGGVAALAGIDGVRVFPGRGVMIAMNHRLVNTVVSRCQMPADGDAIVPIRTVCVIGTTDQRTDDPDDQTIRQDEVDQMLDDGERLVPGFREARALRAWSGVRPLFEDAKASDTDNRDVTRAHALLDHEQRDGVGGFLTITGGKLTTLRLMAEHTVDAVCRKLSRGAPLYDLDRAAPGLRERRHLQARRAPRGQGDEAYRGADDLRVRAGWAREPGAGDRSRPRRQPRRRAAPTATRDGPVSGRLLHLPCDRDHARARRSRRGRGRPLAARLPAGALEGRVAGALRRPAAASTPRRVDLPRSARRRASTHVT